IPNFLQNLLGEGVLSASFIPAYATLLAEGRREEAGRLAGAVAALLGLITALLALVGVVGAPWLVAVVAPGFAGETRVLTIQLVRAIFPGIGVLVLSAWCLGVLNAHRRFFLSYVSPVLWNGAMIAALLVVGPGGNVDRTAVVVGWASVGGSLLQFLVQVPAVLRLEPRLRVWPDLRLPALRPVLSRFGTTVVGRGVVQLSGFIDAALASLIGAGAVATLQYSQVLSLLPISLFGMAISAAELPAMAGETGDPERVAAAVRQRLDAGLARLAYFVIPSAAAFLTMGGVIAEGIYRGGAFTGEQARWVWVALAGSAVGLLAGTMGRLYASACYAGGDATTPFRAAVLRVVTSGALGWVGALWVPRWLSVDARWGILALTASYGVAAWIEYAQLKRVVDRRVGETGVVMRRVLALWGCGLAAGGVGTLTARLLADAPAVAVTAAACAAFGATYLGLTRLARLDDARRT
ncbi:MAG: murein biosynthesis integral rane protein MurJ, partial [Gemmatimonadota bacterium]